MKSQFLAFSLVGVTVASVVILGNLSTSSTLSNPSDNPSSSSSLSSPLPSPTSSSAPSSTSSSAPSSTSSSAPSSTSSSAPSSAPSPASRSTTSTATQSPSPSSTSPLPSSGTQVNVLTVNPAYTAVIVDSPANVLTTEAASFRVRVTDQSGRPAIRVPISFKFRASQFTSVYTAMGTVNSDNSGYATLQYRFTSPGTPQVFAGSEATSNYGRFWSSAHNITAAAPVFTASFVNPPANALTTQATSFTVLVRDQNGNPAVGVPTSFRFRDSSFTSIFTAMGTVNSDNSGYATLQYRFTSPGTPQVFAGSEATSNYGRFWSSAHNITAAAPVFTASFVNPPANALTTQATSFTVLVRDQNGNPAVGIPISLKFRTSSSTSFFTAMGTVTSDNSGQATLQYRFTSTGTPQVFAGSEATSNYGRFWSSGVSVSVG